MNADVRVIAKDFISQLQQLGGEAVYETMPEWTHEITCIQSYSTARLDWVFAHTLPAANGIEPVSVENQKDSAVWYNLLGVRMAQPSTTGLYIYDGKKMM